jgi:hypothetical protein
MVLGGGQLVDSAEVKHVPAFDLLDALGRCLDLLPVPLWRRRRWCDRRASRRTSGPAGRSLRSRPAFGGRGQSHYKPRCRLSL